MVARTSRPSRRVLPGRALLTGLLPGFLCGATLAAAQDGAPDPAAIVGPGAVQVDVFHPDRAREVTPRFGGRVIVHVPNLPDNICYPLENSAVTRRMLYELHETLLAEDWEYHDLRPNVARAWTVEDMVVLKDERRDDWRGTPGVVEVRVRRDGELAEGEERHRSALALYGRVEETADGVRVTPASKGAALAEPRDVPAADVESVQQGTVFTFELRDDVRWQPSLLFEKQYPEEARRLREQRVDAQDVLFSWRIYSNPQVRCDQIRYAFTKVTDAEIVDPSTIRFFYEAQDAFALGNLATTLTLLPRHVYDLSDPDNPEHREATAEEQAAHINENPHNRLWVGLGPYQLTEWTDQYVEARRFADDAGKCLYFDREHAGYVDTIRWRFIAGDEIATNAVLNGEIDFFERLNAADYFGGRSEEPAFHEHFYKGFKYLGVYGYVAWNLYRPALQEFAVRKAIALAVDMEGFRQSFYKGLARQVTGPFPPSSAAYARDVLPFERDLDAARDLLEDAGWYDRDGDGVRDKDGVPLDLEILLPVGNQSAKQFGLMLQESLAALEIRLRMVEKDWPSLLTQVMDRDFDCTVLAWYPPLESDPEQIWHSRNGARKESSNNSGLQDPKVDALIARGQRELDTARRMEVWHELHRYLYREVQPYLFMYNVPQKFAMSLRLRGMQTVAIDPGYVIRRWYFWDPEEPGTRTTLDR